MLHSRVAWRVVLFSRLRRRSWVVVGAERVRNWTRVLGRGFGAETGGPVQRCWGRWSKMEGKIDPRMVRRKKGQDIGWGWRDSKGGRMGWVEDMTMGFAGSEEDRFADASFRAARRLRWKIGPQPPSPRAWWKNHTAVKVEGSLGECSTLRCQNGRVPRGRSLKVKSCLSCRHVASSRSSSPSRTTAVRSMKSTHVSRSMEGSRAKYTSESDFSSLIAIVLNMACSEMTLCIAW